MFSAWTWRVGKVTSQEESDHKVDMGSMGLKTYQRGESQWHLGFSNRPQRTINSVIYTLRGYY